jgi:hypothetical protein
LTKTASVVAVDSRAAQRRSSTDLAVVHQDHSLVEVRRRQRCQRQRFILNARTAETFRAVPRK